MEVPILRNLILVFLALAVAVMAVIVLPPSAPPDVQTRDAHSLDMPAVVVSFETAIVDLPTITYNEVTLINAIASQAQCVVDSKPTRFRQPDQPRLRGLVARPYDDESCLKTARHLLGKQLIPLG